MALNKSETEALDKAQTILVTVGEFLRRLEEGGEANTGELEWLRQQVKLGHDYVKTVKTMKGHYPS